MIFILKIILFIILLICISSDIGGILFGKIFKGPKLTKISPNKTISGSLGSFVLSILMSSVLLDIFLIRDLLKLFSWFPNFFMYKWEIYFFHI